MKDFNVRCAEGLLREARGQLKAIEEIKFDRAMSLEELAQRFDDDANIVVEFLTTVLPQGTVDRVIGKLLTKKASHFIIPMEGRK